MSSCFLILFQNSSKVLPPIFSWPQSIQVGRPRGTVLHLCGWGGGPKYLSKGMESKTLLGLFYRLPAVYKRMKVFVNAKFSLLSPWKNDVLYSFWFRVLCIFICEKMIYFVHFASNLFEPGVTFDRVIWSSWRGYSW